MADNSDALLKVHLEETIDGVVTKGETIPNANWKFCYGAGATFAPPGIAHGPARTRLLNCAVRIFDPARRFDEKLIRRQHQLGRQSELRDRMRLGEQPLAPLPLGEQCIVRHEGADRVPAFRGNH